MTGDENYFLSVTRLDKSEGYKGVDKTLLAINLYIPYKNLNKLKLKNSRKRE